MFEICSLGLSSAQAVRRVSSLMVLDFPSSLEECFNSRVVWLLSCSRFVVQVNSARRDVKAGELQQCPQDVAFLLGVGHLRSALRAARVGDLSYLLFVLSVLVSRVEVRTLSLWNGADLIGFLPSCCERS